MLWAQANKINNTWTPNHAAEPLLMRSLGKVRTVAKTSTFFHRYFPWMLCFNTACGRPQRMPQNDERPKLWGWVRPVIYRWKSCLCETCGLSVKPWKPWLKKKWEFWGNPTFLVNHGYFEQHLLPLNPEKNSARELNNRPTIDVTNSCGALDILCFCVGVLSVCRQLFLYSAPCTKSRNAVHEKQERFRHVWEDSSILEFI